MKTISKLWQRFRENIDKFCIIVVLLLVALAVAVMVSECIACYLQQLLGLDGKYDVLQTIGLCIAGVLLVWQAWAANKRAKAMEDNAREQVKATANTEAKQRQERQKNAIEHLGHKSETVRIGGAYELFHLAKDTKGLKDSESLHQAALGTLSAHIRQTTTNPKGGRNAYQMKHKTEPSGEIRDLLKLLFIDEHDVFEDYSVNLQDSYLNGANLREAQLQGADLSKAQLQGADLSKAQLQGANLREAQLQQAQLQGADLMNAQLQQAQLQGAYLAEAQLQGADLELARMQVANLSKAQLQGANLKKARMQVADLSEAQLQGANLNEAQLQGANLEEEQLQGVSSWVYSLLSSPLSSFLSEGFKSKIRDRIGKHSGLTKIISAAELQEEDLKTLCEGLSAGQARALREKLTSQVGKPASHEVPPDSGAKTGAYTQKNDTANANSAPDSDKDKGN